MAPEDLGKFLKRRREDLKLKQQEISEMTGFTRSQISLIENNSKSLRYDELLKFLDCLGLVIEIKERPL